MTTKWYDHNILQSREIFYSLKENNLDDIHRFNTLCFVNIVLWFLLLCYTFHFRWWEENRIIALVASGIYFFSLIIFHYSHKNSIFEFFGLRSRLKCWKYYYRSPSLVDYYHGQILDYVSLYNEDFVQLSNNAIVKVRTDHSFYAKDIDMNKVYYFCIELIDLSSNKVLYSSKKRDYNFGMTLLTLQEELNKEELQIITIYNKYGDVRWESGTQTKESKLRAAIYNIVYFSMSVIYITMAITPIAIVLPGWSFLIFFAWFLN